MLSLTPTLPSFFRHAARLFFLLLLTVSLSAVADGKKPHHKTPAKTEARSCPLVISNRHGLLDPVTQKKLDAALHDLKHQGMKPTLTTTFRSRSEQSSLYRCSRKKRCRTQRGIFDAAPPGASLHEAGLAVDVAGVAYEKRGRRHLTRHGRKVVQTMRKHGFNWRYGLHDPVHFEINPRQAGFRTERKAIQVGQQRWITQSRALNCRAGKRGRKAAASAHQPPARPRLQQVVNLSSPARQR